MVDEAELHRMVHSEDLSERREAVKQLQNSFSILDDKKQAWKDLLELMKDKYLFVRVSAAGALGSAFAYVTDKEQATKELQILTKDEDSDVRRNAAIALGSAFAHVTDKEKVWEDLLKLTKDKDSSVRSNAADALGSAFAHVTDKEQATKDLLELTKDEESEVQEYATHSLGRVYIFKATKSESDEKFRANLEKALEFFEESNKGIFRPAGFCLPFYRSFYTITFKGQEAEAEVEKYLTEAKQAVEGSKSKEKLLEAVENLGNALKEAQKQRETDLEAMKSELNAYRRYCDRAVELLDTTGDKAPGASELIRRGLPIIDRRIKQIIEEIKEKAKIGCQQSIGTPNEELACAVNQKTQSLPIDDLEQLTRWVDDFVFLLNAKIPSSPENKYVHDEIDKIRNEGDILKQLNKILLCVGLIPTVVTMIDNSKNIEITNSSVGDVFQAENVHLDKSTNVSFNITEFSAIIKDILINMEKIGAKDSNAKLAKLEFEKAKLQAESGEGSKTVATTMDNATKYLKRSEEIINSAGNISQLLMKAGKLVGYALPFL
ncbi:MAG: HEAT repeat domain-containing protein [Methanosarcinaceae archaeon]|nr:HEAT repeat domain-containing protein [Methanosarcinaceae archaeon]